MPIAGQITVTLPQEALEIARSRIASGEFSTESEVIAQALLESVLPPYEGPSEAFLQECGRRYDRMRADPSRGLTVDQAFAFLDDED